MYVLRVDAIRRALCRVVAETTLAPCAAVTAGVNAADACVMRSVNKTRRSDTAATSVSATTTTATTTTEKSAAVCGRLL